MKITKNKKAVIEEIVLYCILILVSVWLLQGKNSFHIDELFSYGLSNHVNGIIMLPPQEGELFLETEKPYYDYLTADDAWEFHYETVWINQETDVHPPFYYAVLHTICSFFSEEFSIWYAGMINIAAVCFTLFILRRIAELLELDAMSKRMISFLFIFSTGIASAICFLRMYALTMFWVVLTAYIFLHTIKRKEVNWKSFLFMFTVAVCGALTHYYYLVYLFFICAVYFIYLLLHDKKKIVPYLLTYGLAGITATGIFPAMTFHMFEDTRGEESIENLNAFTVESFCNRFKQMEKLVDKQLFAGNFYLLFIGTLLILGGMIYLSYRKEKKINLDSDGWLWCVLVIPCVCYFVLVTQIAVYIDVRYIIPIFAILIIAVYGILFELISKWNLPVSGRAVVCFLGILMIVSMVHKNECDYRKLPEMWNEHFARYGESDCIYIHDNSWRIQASFAEIRNYGSVRFFSEEYFQDYSEKDTEKTELVAVIVNECNQEEVIEKIFELYPKLKKYEVFTKAGYSSTYCFSE